MFCTNSSHHPNRSPIIFVSVAMASSFLLYPRSSCAKTFYIVCCTKIYINLKIYVIHITEIVVYIVCLYCRLCICHSLDEILLLLLLLLQDTNRETSVIIIISSRTCKAPLTGAIHLSKQKSNIKMLKTAKNLKMY